MQQTALLASPPTHFYVPEGARFTLADEICDLMSDVGYQVDEPERLATRALFPQKANGDWIGLDSGIVAPRQNLKTAIEIGGALHDTFVQGVDVAWTAHEFKTSSEAFRDFQAVIEGNDWLAAEVLNVRTSHGFEGFDLRNGARLDVIARTGKSGRGMARARLYLDEALFLTPKIMGAIVPTMSAMPNAHMVVGSSPGLPTSGVLREMRDRGRSGNDPNLGWIEWSQERGQCASADCSHRPGTPGCWLDDLEAVIRVNPAAGRRISLDYLPQERLTLSGAIAEYLRERMGVWEDPPLEAGENGPFPVDKWEERLDLTSRIPDGARLALAVDTSWDRQTTWISVCGVNSAGIPHVEIVATNYGQDWVEGWITERLPVLKPIAIGLQSGNSPVSSLLEKLQARFGEVITPMSGQDLARSCGSFYDAVDKGPLAHPAQEQLDDAVRLAAIRTMGDSWLLDRKASSYDIAGLVAAVEAHYLLLTTPEPKKRSGRVVGF